jgi:hypothetical protein
MEAIDTHEYRGYLIEEHYEEDGYNLNPRENSDSMGKIFMESECRYIVGDEQVPMECYGNWVEWLKDEQEDVGRIARKRIAIAIPLQFQDYGSSGCRLTADVRDIDLTADWINGLYVIYRDDLLREYSVKIVTPAAREKATKYALAEIEEYGAWLSGEVYSYAVREIVGYDDDDNPILGELVDSCTGFYGDKGRKWMYTEATMQIDALADAREHKHAIALIAGL